MISFEAYLTRAKDRAANLIAACADPAVNWNGDGVVYDLVAREVRLTNTASKSVKYSHSIEFFIEKSAIVLTLTVTEKHNPRAVLELRGKLKIKNGADYKLSFDTDARQSMP